MTEPPASAIRVFVSSPGDVGEERELLRRILERLSREFGSRVALEAYLWEANPLYATSDFQSQIDDQLRPGESDFAVFVLWSRMGTMLPATVTRDDGSRYQSGTEYEFEDAVQGFLDRGTPKVLVYRKTATPVVEMRDADEVEERLRQHKLLNAFFDRNFSDGESLTRAYFQFENSDDFETLVENHLRKALLERIDREESPGERVWQGSPFRGLEMFEREHADIFFGRTRAISRILTLMKGRAAEGTPFAMVLGMSGVGKSSLIRAGVLPFLTAPGVVEGVGVWRSLCFTPAEGAADLIGGLATALAGDACLPELRSGRDEAALRALAQDTPEDFVSAVRETLDALATAEQDGGGAAARCVLFVDQFEELFTSPEISADARTAFIDLLHDLVTRAQIWTLCAVRSDAYPRLQALPRLDELRSRGTDFDLLPPSAPELQQIIRQPARLAGLVFETRSDDLDLDELLADQAVTVPEGLPLLEFTLEQLYQGRDATGTLTFAAYEAMGGLAGSISRMAENVTTELDEEVREALPALLRRLVSIDAATGSAFRRSIALAELTDSPQQETLVRELVDARLLVTRLSADGTPTVTLVHESLLRLWARVRSFIAEEREFLTMRAQFEQAALFWDSEGRPSALLLQDGPVLQRATAMLDRHAADFDEHTRDFLIASVSKERERRAVLRRSAARDRTRRLATIVGSLVLVATIGTGIYLAIGSADATRQAQRAEEQRRTESMASGYALVSSDHAGRGEYHDALRMAVNAVRLDPSSDNLGVLRGALTDLGKVDVLLPGTTTAGGDVLFLDSMNGGIGLIDAADRAIYVPGATLDLDVTTIRDVEVLDAIGAFALLTADALVILDATLATELARIPAPAPLRDRSAAASIHALPGQAAAIVHWGSDRYAWIDLDATTARPFSWSGDLVAARALGAGERVVLQGDDSLGLLDVDELTAWSFVPGADDGIELSDRLAAPTPMRFVGADPTGRFVLLARTDRARHELWDLDEGRALARFTADRSGDAWTMGTSHVARLHPELGLEFRAFAEPGAPRRLDFGFDAAQVLGSGAVAIVDQFRTRYLIDARDADVPRVEVLELGVERMEASAETTPLLLLDDGALSAWDEDGARLWRHAFEARSGCPPSLLAESGVGRVAACETVVVAVDTASGERLDAGSDGRAIVGRFGDVRVVRDGSDRLLAVDGASGRLLRQLVHDRPLDRTLVASSGHLLALDEAGTAHVWTLGGDDGVSWRGLGPDARLARSSDAGHVGLFAGSQLVVVALPAARRTASWQFDHPVTAARIAAGGESAFVGLADGTVHYVDADEQRTLHRHDGAVRTLDLVHDRLLSGADDGAAVLVDPEAGTVLRRLAHWGPVDHGAPLPDASTLVTATRGGVVQFRDVASDARLPFTSLGRRVLTLAAATDRAVLVVDSTDAMEVELVEARTEAPLGTLPGDLAGVTEGVLSLDRSRALLAAGSTRAWIYDFAASAILGETSLPSTEAGRALGRGLQSAAASLDAAAFAVADAEGDVLLWTSDGWHALPRPGSDADGEDAAPPLRDVRLAFSEDGSVLIERSSDGVAAWSVATLEPVEAGAATAPLGGDLQALRTRQRPATDIIAIDTNGIVERLHRFDRSIELPVLARGGHELVYRLADGRLELFDVAADQVRLTITPPAGASDIGLTDDGRAVLLVEADGTLRSIPLHARDLLGHAQLLLTGEI